MSIAVALAALALAAPPAASQVQASTKCENGFAGPYPCKNVDMASFMPLPSLGGVNGNDIWGWTDPRTGREYAIMGTGTGTGFVDVTDPDDPVLVGTLPTRGTADLILWRDIKVDGNYAFIVSEISNSGLQIFDLRRLRNPGSTPAVFTSDATFDRFSSAHNIAVNRATDFAYVVGSDKCDNGDEAGGLYMVDISEPLNPRFAGCARVRDADGNDETESNNYVHDAECEVYRGPDRDYRGREICLGSNENVVVIYDVTNKDRPRIVSKTSYPTAAYTHQGSLTPDQRYFLFGDELDEQEGTVDRTTTYIMSVRDLDDPGKPKRFAHRTRSIDHNLYTHGRYVYESNYTAGLRILKYSDRSLAEGRLDEVAFFDVVPGVDFPEFAGTWSNYRFPGSGTTVVSTIENEVNGLFVLRPRLGDGEKNRQPRCKGQLATMKGDRGDDVIEGTRRRDVIIGRGGSDTIRGLGGQDVICGDGGNDRVNGGAADDQLHGGKGVDRLSGRAGEDTAWGAAGDDHLFGGRHADALSGQKGDDVLRGGPGRDRLRGGQGRDDVQQ